MQTGLQKIKDNYYFFDLNDGAMVKNKVMKIDGFKYTFGPNGYATEVEEIPAKPSTGFWSYEGITCYYKDGVMVVSDWVEEEGKQYYFDEAGQMVTEDGRELVIRIRVFDDFDGGDLESDYDGEELGVIIAEWIADNTLRGKFNTAVATANQMTFENVTVPMQNDRGRDLDARTWLRGLQRFLQQRYGIESKIMTQGLGAATLVIGGK